MQKQLLYFLENEWFFSRHLGAVFLMALSLQFSWQDHSSDHGPGVRENNIVAS